MTSSFLIIGVSKETIRTGTEGLVTSGGTLSIPATNDWTSAGVLALKEARLPAHTRVLVTTVHVIGATGLLDAEAVLAAVEGRTLARVTAL